MHRARSTPIKPTRARSTPPINPMRPDDPRFIPLNPRTMTVAAGSAGPGPGGYSPQYTSLVHYYGPAYTIRGRSGRSKAGDSCRPGPGASNGELQDSANDVRGVYNQNTRQINGEYGDADLDKHGNPKGSEFDLAKDEAFAGFKLLVGCFFTTQETTIKKEIETHAVKELEKKGWVVDIVCDEIKFAGVLQDNSKYHIAWIISGADLNFEVELFVDAVRKFHKTGRGLMIWGGAHPYHVHANLILGNLFNHNFHLKGDQPGGQEMRLGIDTSEPRQVGNHLVFSGIRQLYEGENICYPHFIPPDSGFTVLATSSGGKPALVAKDVKKFKSGPGRIIVDMCLAKLNEPCFANSAGIPRYVSNCCAWLALRERFKGPASGFATLKKE